MIEINTTELQKETQQVLVRRKGQKPFYQERKKKSIDERRKEMKARMRADNTAQEIWDYRMGTDEDRARIDAEEAAKKADKEKM